MNGQLQLTKSDRAFFFRKINEKSDRIMQIAMVLYFLNGIFLAFFYDTWLVGLGVGGLCLLAYFSAKFLLPESVLHQYVASAVFPVFMAQFIYQMHGLFEMHFWVFVATTLLITYQNWKLFIPLSVVILVHHAGFAWLQFTGIKEVYFTQMDYMDLQTFLFHATLAVLIVAICAYWSYDLSQKTIEDGLRQKELERQLKNVDKNILFAEDISKGNLQKDYQIENEDDHLGKALTEMQQSLLKAREREQQERFISQGMALINETLRKHMNNIQELGDQVLHQLIVYLKLNQGAFFVLEDENDQKQLVLKSCYAYNRKKYKEKVVEIGQGLAGQAFLEKDYIYITDVPQGYTTITSGLGESTASSILIVPMINNSEVVGVLEVASLQKIPTGYIEFLLKVSESIASTILSAKTNDRTTSLLEKARLQSEALLTREEEMKQSMEELVSTQEEMNRRSKEFEKLLSERENEIQNLRNKLKESQAA